jgi:hypothetical protein
MTMRVRCDGRHLWTVMRAATGEVTTMTADQIVSDGVDKWLFPAPGGRWLRARSVRAVGPEPVRCIRVDDPSHLYVVDTGDGLIYSHNTGGGKSVLQRNIIFHVITHAKEIKFLGIDLKRVELSRYKKYSNAVLGVATTLEDAVEILRFARETMMNRYADMEGITDNFLELKNAGPALLVMVDEAGELLDQGGGKALRADTEVRNLEGRANIGEIETGDHVLGEDGRWHEVTETLRPPRQREYSLTFARGSDGRRESFVAGENHDWVVTMPGGERRRLSTGELHALWSATPPAERRGITFTRAAAIEDDAAGDADRANTRHAE